MAATTLAGGRTRDRLRGPFVFADVLDLPRDLYYGIYAASVVVFFVLRAGFTGRPINAMIRRR